MGPKRCFMEFLMSVAICLKNISFASKVLSLQYSHDEFGVSVLGCQTQRCCACWRNTPSLYVCRRMHWNVGKHLYVSVYTKVAISNKVIRSSSFLFLAWLSVSSNATGAVSGFHVPWLFWRRLWNLFLTVAALIRKAIILEKFCLCGNLSWATSREASGNKIWYHNFCSQRATFRILSRSLQVLYCRAYLDGRPLFSRFCELKWFAGCASMSWHTI